MLLFVCTSVWPKLPELSICDKLVPEAQVKGELGLE